MEPVRGTKPHSMYEKSDVKTNIIRYYFVAIHPMDKTHRVPKDRDEAGTHWIECIYNLHAHMCAVLVQEKYTFSGISGPSVFFAHSVTCDT